MPKEQIYFPQTKNTKYQNLNVEPRQNRQITLDLTSCRLRRTSLGWSERDLALRSGFSISAIVDFEEGRRVLSEAAQVSLLRALRKGSLTPQISLKV